MDVGLSFEGLEQPRSEDERFQRRPMRAAAAGLEEMVSLYNEGCGDLLELEAAGDGPGDVLVWASGGVAAFEVERIPLMEVLEDGEFPQTRGGNELKERFIVTVCRLLRTILPLSPGLVVDFPQSGEAGQQQQQRFWWPSPSSLLAKKHRRHRRSQGHALPPFILFLFCSKGSFYQDWIEDFTDCAVSNENRVVAAVTVVTDVVAVVADVVAVIAVVAVVAVIVGCSRHRQLWRLTIAALSLVERVIGLKSQVLEPIRRVTGRVDADVEHQAGPVAPRAQSVHHLVQRSPDGVAVGGAHSLHPGFPQPVFFKLQAEPDVPHVSLGAKSHEVQLLNAWHRQLEIGKVVRLDDGLPFTGHCGIGGQAAVGLKQCFENRPPNLDGQVVP